ncbi:hypothetical protein TSUD_214740 [Trifolium subterraneum]|uniref:Uncharacterized protein n=1 Tax=Trifolium subterraneum TaxID=3900 RepID=A0A2Z6MGL5_TRISU|nr:hypothetical protein TSUD_214740 [Trifolium subterraneum]
MEVQDVHPLEEVLLLNWVRFSPRVMDAVYEKIQCHGIELPISSLWSLLLELVGHTQIQLPIITSVTPPQIGNPLLNLDRDSQATYDYFWSHGMISDEIGLAITKDCDFDDYTFASPHNVSESCNNAISDANKIVGDYINNYDVILDVCYPSIVQQELRLKKMCFKLQRYRS